MTQFGCGIWHACITPEEKIQLPSWWSGSASQHERQFYLLSWRFLPLANRGLWYQLEMNLFPGMSCQVGGSAVSIILFFAFFASDRCILLPRVSIHKQGLWKTTANQGLWKFKKMYWQIWPWCFKIYRPSKIFSGPGLLAVVFHKPWINIEVQRITSN